MRIDKLTAVLFVLLACLTALPVACARERPVRIVLVTIDTLRWDSFEPESGDTGMPNTRAAAEKGAVFERFYASTSVTQPTHASLLTGLHPWEHGVTRNGQVLGDPFRTVAEQLRESGFTTHAVVGSFPLHSRFGFSQGFDVYHEGFGEPYRKSWEGYAVDDRRFFSLAKDVSDRALDQLATARGERQFFWFHYFDPHDPYGDSASRPDAVRLQSLLDLSLEGGASLDAALKRARQGYARDVAEVDAQLGRLLRQLEEEAQRFETHVLVTADHGESFGEKGILGHGRRATSEQLRVPTLLISPRVESGWRRDPASSIDVPATLLALAGLDAGVFPGRDLTRPGALDAPILGMRRSFESPALDRPFGRSPVPLPPHWFFSVEEGIVYAGNAEAVFVEDDPDRPTVGAQGLRLRALFGGLAEALDVTQTEELLEDDVREGLEALGYVR